MLKGCETLNLGHLCHSMPIREWWSLWPHDCRYPRDKISPWGINQRGFQAKGTQKGIDIFPPRLHCVFRHPMLPMVKHTLGVNMILVTVVWTKFITINLELTKQGK